MLLSDARASGALPAAQSNARGYVVKRESDEFQEMVAIALSIRLLQPRQLLYAVHAIGHRVLAREIDRQIRPLIVIRRENEVMLPVHEESLLLRLVPRQDDLRLHLLRENPRRLRRHVPSPDQLIHRPRPPRVIGPRQRTVKNIEVELLDLAVRRK